MYFLSHVYDKSPSSTYVVDAAAVVVIANFDEEEERKTGEIITS